MKPRLKGRVLNGPVGGVEVSPAEISKALLRSCLESVHSMTRRYYYRVLAEKSIPGCLSYLLSIREVDLVEILKICGFYQVKKGVFQFQFRVFETWVAATFERKTVEVTTYCYPDARNKKIPLIKIGLGDHPNRPASQLKEKLEPPRFRMQTDPDGQSSKDSLMLLFKKPPGTPTLSVPPPQATSASSPTTGASGENTYSPVKLAERFNISTPEKTKLAMELVCEMDTPRKVPIMRELVKGSTMFIETHNNQRKSFVHIPKCSTEKSAMSQMIKYRFLHEIVNILGGGAASVLGGLNQGALWLCRGMQFAFSPELSHSAARAGVTCITRMSPKASAAMWTDAKLTEDTSRNIIVRRQLDQVRQNRKRKFTVHTVAKRAEKAEEAIAVKKERRVLL
jgi:hypothetical protein